MSKKQESQGGKKPQRKRRGLHWSTIVAVIVCIPVAWLTLRSGREWLRVTRHQTELENEISSLTARNAVLKPAWEALQNQHFQVCNKSPDAVTVNWLAAVYQDGRRLKLFDPKRCEGWRPQVIPPGSQKMINFSSPDAACNWSGSVTFFAMRYSLESADGVKRTLDYAGPWVNFDRDCYTVN
jgi:cell division protein FtsB